MITKDLFGVVKDHSEESWRKHWKDMPEYQQDDKEAIKSVNINFQSLDDLHEFNRVTGLNVTMQTKGAFFPNRTTKKITYVKD